jgi:hypothetical protein
VFKKHTLVWPLGINSKQQIALLNFVPRSLTQLKWFPKVFKKIFHGGGRNKKTSVPVAEGRKNPAGMA